MFLSEVLTKKLNFLLIYRSISKLSASGVVLRDIVVAWDNGIKELHNSGRNN